MIFGADKTKVTITGSRQDMSYYKDINLWSLDGEPLAVTEDNEHLGLIVSGIDEEIKNVDKNIDAARNSIFNLLGNIFSYKCKTSQTVQLHVWSLYVNPLLRSGLAALPIRPTIMMTLSQFHHKVLRGILKLGPVSPIPPLYFLLGELPMEAALHLDVLTLFWSIWANPQTKIHDIVKYLLTTSDSSSLTWSAHLRLLFQMYSLPDPLTLLSSPLWSKEKWKMLIKTKITSYHEAALRYQAARNSKLAFLNVQVQGLTGRPHPILKYVLTTQEALRSRPHVRMLAGDYPCFSYLGSDRHQDASCRLCLALSPHQPAPEEDMVHLLTRCRRTAAARTRIMPDLMNLISQHFPSNDILVHPNHTHLTQLILDPTSLNLPMNIRISPDHPALPAVLTMCRNLCFFIDKARTQQLRLLKEQAAL